MKLEKVRKILKLAERRVQVAVVEVGKVIYKVQTLRVYFLSLCPARTFAVSLRKNFK